MITASFNEIRNKIQDNIGRSKNSILVAVAWFTSKDLLGQLTDKAESGCKVEIVISDHIENQRLSFERFINNGGHVYIIPTKSGKFLHDKFAIFDGIKLIAGSYNWTNCAEYFNHEFIIQSDDTLLLKQFSIRFESLKKIVVDYDKLKLLDNNHFPADNKEAEFIKLENELEAEFFDTIKTANELGANIKSASIINYIHFYGAIGSANRLIKSGTDKLQSGLLKLWEINRLDLSFESIILKPKYRILFSNEILENAKRRLNELATKK